MPDYFARLADSAMVQEDWDEAVDNIPPQEEEDVRERGVAEGIGGGSVPWDDDWTSPDGNKGEGRSWGDGAVGQARQGGEGEEEAEEEGEGNSEDGDSDSSSGDEEWTAGQEFDFGNDTEESDEREGRGGESNDTKQGVERKERKERGGEKVDSSNEVRGKGGSLAELMRKINRGEAERTPRGKTPMREKQREAEVHPQVCQVALWQV